MSDAFVNHAKIPDAGAREQPPIPMNDLSRRTRAMRAEFDRAIAVVIDSGWYMLGPQVSAFEAEFARYCGVRHAIGVANGTDALELALRAIGSGPGKEIVTVANAGMYAATAIVATGATPVFADIDPSTMTISPAALERSIGARTVAVVATHLYGKLADMNGLMSVARRHRIAVIEDCAQAAGAERDGQRAGAFGAIGCFSFYPSKNIGAFGDGGALTTSDDELGNALRQLRQYGWRDKYDADRPHGRNSRLDELQAAILRVQLPKLDRWNARRREIVQRYRRASGDAVAVPHAAEPDHVAHLCVVRCANRTALREFLAAHKIASEIHYPIPDHRQRALRGLIAADVELPQTVSAVDEILTLPCFPEMTDEEIERVCAALAAFCSQEQPR